MNHFLVRLSKFYKLFFSLIICLVISLHFTSNVSAQTSYVELFEKKGELNLNIWEHIRIDNTFFSSDSRHNYLEFSGISSHTFEYLRSRQFEDYDNDLSIRFYLRSVGTNQGAGIAVSDTLQIDGQRPNFSSYLFYIWPRPDGTYHLFTPLCPTSNLNCNVGSQLNNGVYKLPMEKWLELSISKDSYLGAYSVLLDGAVIFQSIPTNKNMRYLVIGNSEGYTDTLSYWPNFLLDEVAINAKLSTVPLDTFPYYSQLDPLWKDVIYDSGDEWNNPGEGTIGRWGCAITSTSMLLNKYGVNMPDGSEPTPFELNKWLKNESDGYVGGGLLNWLAITRLAHKSHLVGQAPKELEFIKSAGSPSDELAAGYYPILNTGKHFVIAYKENEIDYSINDPLSKLIINLPKTTTVRSVNTFIPSETDLSYILLVANPDINLTFPDSIYFDETLADEESSHTITKRLYYIRQPDTKTYKFLAQGEADSEIEVYLYSREGEVVVDKLTLVSNEPTSFLIVYNPDISTSKVVVDSAPILTYLRSLRIAKSPFNGIMQALYAKFVDYFAYINQGIETSSYAKDLVAFVNKQSPKHIPIEVKTTIQNYVRLIEVN